MCIRDSFEVDAPAVGLHDEFVAVRIDEDRKVRAAASVVDPAVAVVVPAEHDIDLGLVENRHEQPADLLFAVPTALAARDHVQEYHVQRSFAVGVAGHHLPQPFGLLRAVGVRGGQSVVADVAVGFVFAAVEHQEEYRTLPEGVVGFAGRGGEVVEVAVRRLSLIHISSNFGGTSVCVRIR